MPRHNRSNLKDRLLRIADLNNDESSALCMAAYYRIEQLEKALENSLKLHEGYRLSERNALEVRNIRNALKVDFY